MTEPMLSPRTLADMAHVIRSKNALHLLSDIHAIKYVLPRAIVAGSPGDGDVYGAQQHGPMLDIVP